MYMFSKDAGVAMFLNNSHKLVKLGILALIIK